MSVAQAQIDGQDVLHKPSIAAHLPPEILQHILRAVPLPSFDDFASTQWRRRYRWPRYREQKATLWAASLVCRAWRSPATRELWRVLWIGGDRYYADRFVAGLFNPRGHDEPHPRCRELYISGSSSRTFDVGTRTSHYATDDILRLLRRYTHALKVLSIRHDEKESVLSKMLMLEEYPELESLSLRISQVPSNRRGGPAQFRSDKITYRPHKLGLYSSPSAQLIDTILVPFTANLTDLTISLDSAYGPDEDMSPPGLTTFPFLLKVAPQLRVLRVVELDTEPPPAPSAYHGDTDLCEVLRLCASSGRLETLQLPIDRALDPSASFYTDVLAAVPSTVRVLELGVFWPLEAAIRAISHVGRDGSRHMAGLERIVVMQPRQHRGNSSTGGNIQDEQARLRAACAARDIQFIVQEDDWSDGETGIYD